MADYKAQITLNEKDSITDLLTLEKTLAKVYTTALTEGVSKGFRDTIKEHLDQTLIDQFEVFTFLTEHDYMRVTASSEQDKEKVKQQFEKVKGQLSDN